jgi:hypothetical protein
MPLYYIYQFVNSAKEIIVVYSDNHTKHINAFVVKCRITDC